MELDAVTNSVLNAIDTNGFRQEGAYNLRYNGQALCHGDSEHIKIRRKEDKQGIDVYISSEAKGEQVHIPVVISKSGMMDIVYNDFILRKAPTWLLWRDAVFITAAAMRRGMTGYTLFM